MKKILVLLCVLIMLLGIVGCNEESKSSATNNPGFTTTTSTTTTEIGSDYSNTSSVPEPATMLLLGSGLAGLAWYGRKKKK